MGYLGLQGVRRGDRGCKGLPGVINFYKGCQGFTRGYKG